MSKPRFSERPGGRKDPSAAPSVPSGLRGVSRVRSGRSEGHAYAHCAPPKFVDLFPPTNKFKKWTLYSHIPTERDNEGGSVDPTFHNDAFELDFKTQPKSVKPGQSVQTTLSGKRICNF